MINIQTFAIGLLAAAVIAGGCYIKGRSDGRQLEVAERATLEEVARVSRDEALAVSAEAISKIDRIHTTIRHQTEVITREKPVYRDCINDPGVERLLDDARANRASEPAGDRGVPGAGPGAAQDVR